MSNQFTPQAAYIRTLGEDASDWACRQPKIGPANDRRIRALTEHGIWLQENAQLIAAAPELLAALEQIAAHNGIDWDWATTGNVARAAIAKATGQATA